MKRYFRSDKARSALGSGTAWIEFDGEHATRQVERYGDRWFTSRDDVHPEIGPGISDRPLRDSDLTPKDEISAEEFERVWEASEANQP